MLLKVELVRLLIIEVFLAPWLHAAKTRLQFRRFLTEHLHIQFSLSGNEICDITADLLQMVQVLDYLRGDVGDGRAESGAAGEGEEDDGEPDEERHGQAQVLRAENAMLPERVLVQIHTGHEKQDEK